jgi:hypothetical protein
MALMAIAIGTADHRAVAVLIGLVFCVPIYPLIQAIRTRLSVPSRWRASAVNASSASVRFDHLLAGSSDRTLQILRVAFVAAGVLAAFGWWYWTGQTPLLLVSLGVIFAVAVDTEIRRRRRRR